MPLNLKHQLGSENLMQKILAFAGSNSSKSVNNQLINWIIRQAQDRPIEQIDIRDYEMPLFGEDLEREAGHPETAIALRQKFSEVDAFIIASPEHNGMMPAVLKNLFDWLSRIPVDGEKGIFGNKPVLLLSASPGPRGGMTNLQNMANVIPFWGAEVKGQYSLGSFYDNFKDGQPSKSHQQKLLEIIKVFQSDL